VTDFRWADKARQTREDGNHHGPYGSRSGGGGCRGRRGVGRPHRRPGAWEFGRRYGIAVLAVAMAIAAKMADRAVDQPGKPVPDVLRRRDGQRVVGRAGPGLLATVLAAAASDFFFLFPQYASGTTGRRTLSASSSSFSRARVISLLGGALHRRGCGPRRRRPIWRGPMRKSGGDGNAAAVPADQRPRRRFDGLDVATLYEAALDEAAIGAISTTRFALPDGKVALVVGDVSGKGLGAPPDGAE
jgi:hypothetical protein